MKILLPAIILFVLTACIKNDIPYPVIYGNVEKLEVEGQQKCVINTKERTVNLSLDETVDIHNVKVKRFEITENAKKNLNTDSTIDLSSKVVFTISTYQDYLWSIETEQTIERYIQVENQVGESVINSKERIAVVYVSKDQNLSQIKITGLKLGPSVAQYLPQPADLNNFQRGQTILVSCFNRTESWTIYIFNHNGETPGNNGELTGKAEPWAKFAFLNGSFSGDSQITPYFEYRKSRETSWTRADATIKGTSFSAKVTQLTPSTTYIYRAIAGDKIGEEVNFTTEAAEQIPYMNFDTWHKEGKAFYPGPEGVRYWDSGNEGGAGFGFNPTTEEKNDAVQGSAARLASTYAVVKFAAGNIYTGDFVKLDVTNAELDFGIPYTHRPTTLSGWYKYNPGIIDRTKSPYDYLKNQTDSCHIYVALCDWDAPFRVVTKTNTFVDLSENNSSILALGELKTNKKMNMYEHFTIHINYRDTARKPKYILIVATASKYGDYFTGSTSSILLIDEFELGFD